MLVDVRSIKSGYIEIGDWVIYVDDSTGEKIIHSWEKDEDEESRYYIKGDILEHTKTGTRKMDKNFHAEYKLEQQNDRYIQDMLGEHDYRVEDNLMNVDGHEVRDLNGMAITIPYKDRKKYKQLNGSGYRTESISD